MQPEQPQGKSEAFHRGCIPTHWTTILGPLCWKKIPWARVTPLFQGLGCYFIDTAEKWPLISLIHYRYPNVSCALRPLVGSRAALYSWMLLASAWRPNTFRLSFCFIISVTEQKLWNSQKPGWQTGCSLSGAAPAHRPLTVVCGHAYSQILLGSSSPGALHGHTEPCFSVYPRRALWSNLPARLQEAWLYLLVTWILWWEGFPDKEEFGWHSSTAA